MLFSVGGNRLRAEVIEDRGDLGVGGERLIRVAWIPSDVDEPVEFEMPASEARVVAAKAA